MPLRLVFTVCNQDDAKHAVKVLQNYITDYSEGLENLNLSGSAKNILSNAKIFNMDSLLSCTENDLLKIPNLGRKTLHEIKESLSIFKLSLSK